jgi:hypothetical protein
MPASVRPVSERRDVELAIEHWQRNTSAGACIPLLDTFDFSSMRADWGQRFLVCGDQAVETSRFIAYGGGFARLLHLPAKPVTATPFIEQISEPYRAMFSEGYSKAIMELSPVTFDGTFRLAKSAELFRAVFLPIMLRRDWSKRLIFGSFNCRAVGAV